MAKRKKNESIADFRKRTDADLIQDTSADPLLCDTNAPEEGRTIEGLLTLTRDLKRSDNITISWRIPDDVLKHAQRVAMEESLKNKENIHYQKLVLGCFLEKYPMEK